MAITIHGYLIDVATAVDHRRDAEVTEHPVEDGADIADHIRTLPAIVVVTGIVSDTPLSATAPRRLGDLPSEEARAHFENVRLAREPITVETATRVYTNMVMQGYSEIVDGKSGDAFNFRATFKQIDLVSNNRTFITVKLPRARRKRNLGNKSAKSAPDQVPSPSSGTTKKRSVLDKIFF